MPTTDFNPLMPINELAAAYGAQLINPFAQRVLSTLANTQAELPEDLDHEIRIGANVARIDLEPIHAMLMGLGLTAELRRDDRGRPLRIEASHPDFVVVVELVAPSVAAIVEPYRVWVHAPAEADRAGALDPPSLIPPHTTTAQAIRILMRGFLAGWNANSNRGG